jgi:hypothetical protein
MLGWGVHEEFVNPCDAENRIPRYWAAASTDRDRSEHQRVALARYERKQDAKHSRQCGPVSDNTPRQHRSALSTGELLVNDTR